MKYFSTIIIDVMGWIRNERAKKSMFISNKLLFLRSCNSNIMF